MGEILRNWIQARLGILMDLTPEAFGHYTRDGTLLAQILHSYDVINHDQLDTIAHTQDPALCRVNLKHLRFWLRFVGVECTDESIEEISCGKGTTSLRLFYKLYLCLETKDRLHFITLQKEREKYVPVSKKFEVTRVCEKPAEYRPPDHPLSSKLAEGKDTVEEWRRSKLPRILRKIRRERRALRSSESRVAVVEPGRREPEGPNTARESDELDRFAHERRVRRKSSDKDEPERTETVEDEEKPRTGTEGPDMAGAYVERLKNRKKRSATVDALEAKVQKALLSELWERIAAKQERTFDEAIAGRALNQSKYEKRIVTKLCEVRDQRNVMAENRKVVKDITLGAKEVENRANYELAKDLASRKRTDVETECRRMCELRERLLAAKVQKIRNEHRTICRRIVEDCAIVASNIGDHRRANDGRVPVSLLAEWKSLFLGGRTIFVEDIPYGARRRDSSEDETERFFKSDACVDFDEAELLRETLLDDYLETNPPWNESLPIPDEDALEKSRLGRTVLGYIAHRLLNGLYARPSNRAQTLLPKSKTVAIVLGIGDPEVYDSVKALLDGSGIRAIRMEDAINYCLERYKEETTNAAYDIGTKKSGEEKDERRKSEPTMDEESTTRERGAQTSRNVPYDDSDPPLTDSAYMGKRAHEFLTLGEPIGNELATKILIEYLRSATNANGWALIDYPATYEQMSLLEAALTGIAPPPDPKSLRSKDATVEDIEDTVPRLVFEDESDPFESNRRSKLVPDPVTTRNESTSSRPFATLFVRVARQPKYFERGGETYEALTEDAPSIDEFYASRGIAHVLYYATFDLRTLKTLARLVIGEPLRRKSSDELFGDALKRFERDARRGPSAKEAVVRRLLTEDELFELERSRDSVDEEERQDLGFDDFSLEIESRPAKPGERNWRWIDFPLPATLLECLAGLWETMERIYVRELKELLFLKSVHASSIGPYVDFVTTNARRFVERPDTKQDLLREFHKAFNAIGSDARNDADVKCELHRRVADFRDELWHICDERRREAEEERRRYVEDLWTVREAIVLFDVYVGLIQAEMDRHVDTMRLLQDYYLGMLRKPLPEARVSKVILNKLDPVWKESVELEEESSEPPNSVEKSPGRNGKERSRAFASAAPAAVDLALLRKEITDAAIDGDEPIRDVETTRLSKGIVDNVRYARSIVDAISASANEPTKLERLAGDSIDPELASRGRDFALEWRYAVEYETERARLKLDAIAGMARLDVAFLLETSQRTFRGIRDFVVDRYRRETKSVDDAANVFCFAIEEGTVLEKEMLLDGDRFVVRSSVCSTKTGADEAASPKEVPSPLRFPVARLARLMEIFQRVAPCGTLCERALVYILEDLASHGREEGETLSLPCSWYRLRSSDISELVARLFERADRIDWREFLVYAMELPFPSFEEILVARDLFRARDPDSREVVTRERFHRTPLWFLVDEFATPSLPPTKRCAEETLERTLAKEMLGRMYAIDRHSVNYTALLLAFCKDGDPSIGFGKALALALGSRVCTDEEDGERYVADLVERTDLSSRETWPRETLETVRSIVDRPVYRVRTEKEIDRTEESSATKLFDESIAESVGSGNLGGEEASRDGSRDRPTKERDAVVYRVSLDLCLTVLAAALPRYALQPEPGGACIGFRDILLPIFRESRDPELDDRNDVVLVHRLLHRESMKRFLTSVGKFTAKSAGDTVREILRTREDGKSD